MAESVTLLADAVLVTAPAPPPAQDGQSVTLDAASPITVLAANSVALTSPTEITVTNPGERVVLTAGVVTVTRGALSASAGANVTIESGQQFTLTGTDTGAASRRWTFGGNTVGTGASVTLTATPVLRTTSLTYTYTVTSVGGETASSVVLVTVLGASLRVKSGGVMIPSVEFTKRPAPVTAPPADLAYQLVADDLTVADGASVATWSPRVGVGAATQATTANQPVVSSNRINGHKAVTFFGLTQALTLSGAPLALGRNKPFLLVSVIYRTAAAPPTSGARTIFGLSTGTTATSGRAVLQSRNVDGWPTALGRRLDSESVSVAAIATNTPTAASEVVNLTAIYRWNTSDLLLFKNGVQVASRTDFQTDGLTSDTTSLVGSIGSNTAGTGEYFAGDLAELRVYNTADLPLTLVNELAQYSLTTYEAEAPASGTQLVASAMPTSNLPDWTYSFGQDFTAPAAIGGAIRTVYSGLRFYEGFVDTSKKGDYAVNDVLSVHDGLLDAYLYTNAAGSHRVACVMPNGWTGYTYGRFEVEFWSEAIPGYKIAFMLWPNSDTWGEGEVDFAEVDLKAGATISQYHHQLEPPGLAKNNAYSAGSTAKVVGERHRAAVEWTPAGVKYFIDGVQKINATTHIPTTPHRLTLQFETDLSATPPPTTSAGHVFVSWAAGWTYTP